MGDRGPRENNGERPRVPFMGSPPHRSGVLNSAHEAVCLLRNLSRRRMTRRTKWEGVAIYGHLVLCRPGGEANGRGDAHYFPRIWVVALASNLALLLSRRYSVVSSTLAAHTSRASL